MVTPTDKEKFIKLARLFRDNYVEKPRSLLVEAWQRRFVFNSHGFLEKVQDVNRKYKSGRQYLTIAEARDDI